MILCDQSDQLIGQVTQRECALAEVAAFEPKDSAHCLRWSQEVSPIRLVRPALTILLRQKNWFRGLGAAVLLLMFLGVDPSSCCSFSSPSPLPPHLNLLIFLVIYLKLPVV